MRTFPPPWNRIGLLFAAAFCDSLLVVGDRSNSGAWDLLARRVRRSDLRFIVLLGDQVYMDGVENLWHLPLDLDRRERRRRKAEVQDAETVQANFVPPLASCRVTSAIKSPRTASTVFFDRSCPSTNSAKLGATSAPPSTGSATTKITCYASEYAVVLNIPPLDD